MNERIYTYNGKPIQFNTKEKKFFVGNVWIKPREGFKTIEEAKHYIDSRAEKNKLGGGNMATIKRTY